MHREHLARIYRDSQYDQARIIAFGGKIPHQIGDRLGAIPFLRSSQSHDDFAQFGVDFVPQTA